MGNGGHPRLARERKTLRAMVHIACEGRHGTQDTLCDTCNHLLRYALGRLDKCPYQASKPTCANCPIHCYHPAMREEIRSVMRYAGRWMMLRHPFLALGHLFDGLRRAPQDGPRQDREPGHAPD